MSTATENNNIAKMTAEQVVEDGNLPIIDLMIFSQNKKEFYRLLEMLFGENSEIITAYDLFCNDREAIFSLFVTIIKAIDLVHLNVIAENMKPIY